MATYGMKGTHQKVCNSVLSLQPLVADLQPLVFNNLGYKHEKTQTYTPYIYSIASKHQPVQVVHRVSYFLFTMYEPSKPEVLAHEFVTSSDFCRACTFSGEPVCGHTSIRLCGHTKQCPLSPRHQPIGAVKRTDWPGEHIARTSQTLGIQVPSQKVLGPSTPT